MSPRGARKTHGSSLRRRLWKPKLPPVHLPPIPKLPPVHLPPIPKVPPVHLPPIPKVPPVNLPPIPKLPPVHLPPLPDLPKPHIPRLAFGLPFLNLHTIGIVLLSIGVLVVLAILAGVVCCCTVMRKKRIAGQSEGVDVEDRVHVHKTVVPGSHRQQPAAPSVHEVIEKNAGINEFSRSEPHPREKELSQRRTVAPS
ncbi:hypothetical protein B296_00038581 [Ensete ventricosum]|uniref:Uncharacterized protein n=1 Tax=Ensete ventricosum TaxID=4639 RepID=A0A426ZK38_ENSVE|nr:hypothetical protein B296_00038581 [Ensete ventricosum]